MSDLRAELDALRTPVEPDYQAGMREVVRLAGYSDEAVPVLNASVKAACAPVKDHAAALIELCDKLVAENERYTGVSADDEVARLAQNIIRSTPAGDAPTARVAQRLVDLSVAWYADQQSIAKLTERNAELEAELLKVNPTPWAYEQACKALHAREDQAERLGRLLADALFYLRHPQAHPGDLIEQIEQELERDK